MLTIVCNRLEQFGATAGWFVTWICHLVDTSSLELEERATRIHWNSTPMSKQFVSKSEYGLSNNLSIHVHQAYDQVLCKFIIRQPLCNIGAHSALVLSRNACPSSLKGGLSIQTKIIFEYWDYYQHTLFSTWDFW